MIHEEMVSRDAAELAEWEEGEAVERSASPEMLVACDCKHQRQMHRAGVGECLLEGCDCEYFDNPRARQPYWQGLNVRLRQPESLLFKRFVDTAVEEARDRKDGLPADEAILAVDWLIVRRTTAADGPEQMYASVEHCCEVLEIDVRRLRGNIRQYLTTALIDDVMRDQDRVARVLAEPVEGDDSVADALFDAPRVVFALDQVSMLELMSAA